MNVDAVDSFGWTALMCAAHSGHLSVVRFLKQRNADVNCTDRRNRTALDMAMEQGHFAVADCLMAERYCFHF